MGCLNCVSLNTGSGLCGPDGLGSRCPQGFFVHTVLMCSYFLIYYRDFSSSRVGSLVKTFSPCGAVCKLFQAETEIQEENCFQQYVATSEPSSVVRFRFICTEMQKALRSYFQVFFYNFIFLLEADVICSTSSGKVENGSKQ